MSLRSEGSRRKRRGCRALAEHRLFDKSTVGGSERQLEPATAVCAVREPSSCRPREGSARFRRARSSRLTPATTVRCSDASRDSRKISSRQHHFITSILYPSRLQRIPSLLLAPLFRRGDLSAREKQQLRLPPFDNIAAHQRNRAVTHLIYSSASQPACLPSMQPSSPLSFSASKRPVLLRIPQGGFCLRIVTRGLREGTRRLKG